MFIVARLSWRFIVVHFWVKSEEVWFTVQNLIKLAYEVNDIQWICPIYNFGAPLLEQNLVFRCLGQENVSKVAENGGHEPSVMPSFKHVPAVTGNWYWVSGRKCKRLWKSYLYCNLVRLAKLGLGYRRKLPKFPCRSETTPLPKTNLSKPWGGTPMRWAPQRKVNSKLPYLHSPLCVTFINFLGEVVSFTALREQRLDAVEEG